MSDGVGDDEGTTCVDTIDNCEEEDEGGKGEGEDADTTVVSDVEFGDADDEEGTTGADTVDNDEEEDADTTDGDNNDGVDEDDVDKAAGDGDEAANRESGLEMCVAMANKVGIDNAVTVSGADCGSVGAEESISAAIG